MRKKTTSKKSHVRLLDSIFGACSRQKYIIVVLAVLLMTTTSFLIYFFVQYNSTQKASAAMAQNTLLSVNFDNDAVGTYTVAAMKKDFNNPAWEDGVSEGFASIVQQTSATPAYSGKSLQIRYPKGKVSSAGATNIPVSLNGSYDDVYFSFRVYFPQGFDFVREGKLSGLCGGKCNSGGAIPTGKDGWSSRVLWRALPENGNNPSGIAQYIYSPDQPDQYGAMPAWNYGGNTFTFTPGVWHLVQSRVKMNTPGKKDGIIQSWLDGQLAYQSTTMRFRDVNTFAIDTFKFETFFGGSTSNFAPPKDEYAYFDDITVYSLTGAATPTPSPTALLPTPVATVIPKPTPTAVPVPTPISSVSAASITLTSNWDKGYCAKVVMKNNSGTSITSWSVTLTMNNSSLISNWSSTFTKKTTGVYAVVPENSSKTIAAGRTNSAIGFCATKTGTNYLPTVKVN